MGKKALISVVLNRVEIIIVSLTKALFTWNHISKKKKRVRLKMLR